MKGITKEFINKLLFVTIAGIIIWNLNTVSSFFTVMKGAFMPLLIGIIFAVILSVPMGFFEKKVFHKLKKKKLTLSLWSSVILFAGVLTGFGFLLFPKLVESLKNVTTSFQSGDAFENMASNNAFFRFIFENLKKITDGFVEKIQEYIPKLMEIVENILKVFVNIFLGLFFAILILTNKEELSRQFKKVINHLFVKKEKLKDVIEMFNLALHKFSKYMGGQIIEALLLGTVTYVLMLIIGLPYAALIAAITALVNLVPMVGGYVGGTISALLIFSVSPEKAIIFVIFIVILQQIEAVTTYPIIVGRYVGLSSFWILASVIIGGGLFGFVGVFLGVPVMAFLHDFVGGLILKKKNKTSLYLDGTKSNVIK